MYRRGLVVEDHDGFRLRIIRFPFETLDVGPAVAGEGDPDVGHEVGELVGGFVAADHEAAEPDVVEDERHFGAVVGTESAIHVRGWFGENIQVLLRITHLVAQVGVLVDAR